MDDEHARRLGRGAGWPREIATHGAVAVRRRILDVLLLDARIFRLDLLCGEELRAELLEQHHGCDTADGVLRRAVEKRTAVDSAVDVGIEQDEQVLIEVVGCLLRHRRRGLGAGTSELRQSTLGCRLFRVRRPVSGHHRPCCATGGMGPLREARERIAK